MRLHVLGCAGGSAPGKYLSSYLVDDVLAIDAGALTTALGPAAQRRLRTVALTHGHLDHTWTLPMLLAHRFDPATPTCRVLADSFTLQTLRAHLFNDRIWPDFTRARVEARPLMELVEIEAGAEIQTDHGHRLTAIPLTHTVPCQAYQISADSGSLIVCGDTTSTTELWRVANGCADLRGLVIECSWPNELETLARRSAHMTAALLGADLATLHADVPIYVTHMKPGYEEQIQQELSELGDSRLRILRQDERLSIGP